MSYNSSAGAKPASFTLFYASCQGNAKNTSYPFKKVISGSTPAALLDKLVKVAAYDHVGCQFRNARNNKGTTVDAYRSNKAFLSADVIIMDVDNTNKDPLEADVTEEQWTTPKDVQMAFPDVPFYVVYSRHHMQAKNGMSPRPKFHVYFPLSTKITDYMLLEDLKKYVQRMFPAFDPNAIKITQFMFGVAQPKVEAYNGNVRIDQFVREAVKAAKAEERLPEVIQEGHRNETLSKYAGKVITRLGDNKKAREVFNQAAERCCPPLDLEELNGIWQSAQRFYRETVCTTPGYVDPEVYDEGDGGESDRKKKKGFIVEDLRRALAKINFKIIYDMILKQTRVIGLPERYSEGNAPNLLTGFIKDYLNSQGITCSRADLIDFLNIIIEENRYNPVQEMLLATKWDKQDRITSLLNDIMRVTANLDKILVTKWLHQCVAMALNDEKRPLSAAGVLVLQGEQGIGKTMLFSKLAVHLEWFANGQSIDMSNKDNIIDATSRWITELGELDSTLKHEQSALKGFLTSNVDTYRMPYAKASATMPRRTSFCGTVNPQEFLNDETGSRRFWVVNVDNINLEAILKLDEDWAKQLWRQVYEELYLPNPAGFCLTAAEMRELQMRNNKYAKPLPGEIEVMDKFNFDAPEGKWRWKKVSEITDEINAKGVNSIHIGRVLAKLKKAKKIDMKIQDGVKMYKVPPLCTFNQYYPTQGEEQNEEPLVG